MITVSIISFIIGAMMMLFAMAMAAMAKEREPRNKAHFYIANPGRYHTYYLYLGKPRRIFSNGRFMFKSAHNGRFITDNITDYNLNPSDFGYMEDGEIREVFLNLEDWV